MNAPGEGLAESLWARMAGLRFRFNDCVRVSRVNYRGRPCYLLSTSIDRQQLRISSSIYQLIALMDGKKPLARACELHADYADLSSQTRLKIARSLVKLQAAGMLVSDVPQNAKSIVLQHREQRRQKITGKRMSLLSPRIALGNPDQLLTRILPWCRYLCSMPVLFVWIGVCAYGALQAVMHWESLLFYGAQRVGDPHSWLLILCVYPALKLLHEFGHCLVAKAAGEPVREMGITFLVFVPVPYVDASAASTIGNKRLRMLVSAAGIMVELFAASVSMWLWQVSQDGLARELSYAVMIIGGLSTLLFNGNPLLRFDGYFVLSDAIEIPNLAERSAGYYTHLIRRHLLGLPSEADGTAGERRWFLFYGLVSPVYRLILCLGIAILLFVSVPVLGLLLAVWIVSMQILYPWYRQLKNLFADAALEGRRARLLGAATGLSAVLVGLSALPLYPSSTLVEGVVLMPEHTVIRAEVDGFVEAMPVGEGQAVRKGQLLYELSNEQLNSDVEIKTLRVEELQARLDVLSFTDRTLHEIHRERLSEAQKELQDLLEQQASLQLQSSADGRFQPLVSVDAPGRFIRQGTAMGYVLSDTDTIVRSVARQADAYRIQKAFSGIDIRLASYPDVTLSGYLVGDKPLASKQLPSAALGSLAQGAIAVDARDQQGLTALESVFSFDIAINLQGINPYAGSRAWVRFEHSPESLLSRCFLSIKRRISGILFDRDTYQI